MSPLVAGPSGFVTLSDVNAGSSPNGASLVFTFNTDQAVQLSVSLVDARFPGSPPIVSNEAGAAQGRRTLTVPLTGMAGQVVNFTISSLTPPPPTLRPYTGSVRIAGSRGGTANPPVPIRFYMFGGTPPPPAGGGPLPPAPGNQGNWNSYAWAQYNPKGTTYPTP